MRTSARSPSSTDSVRADDHPTESHVQPATAVRLPANAISRARGFSTRLKTRAAIATQNNARALQPHDDGKKPPFDAASPVAATNTEEPSARLAYLCATGRRMIRTRRRLSTSTATDPSLRFGLSHGVSPCAQRVGREAFIPRRCSAEVATDGRSDRGAERYRVCRSTRHHAVLSTPTVTRLIRLAAPGRALGHDTVPCG
jgi:hypothetical protein